MNDFLEKSYIDGWLPKGKTLEDMSRLWKNN